MMAQYTTMDTAVIYGSAALLWTVTIVLPAAVLYLAYAIGYSRGWHRAMESLLTRRKDG